MISQQITMLENNLFNLNAQPYDPLAFPIAYELLSKCKKMDSTRPDAIVELITWIQLVRRIYPYNIIEMTANERKIDEKIFAKGVKATNGCSNGSNRRDSLSIFDNLNNAEPIAPTQLSQSDEALKPVLECVSTALKILVFVLNVQKSPYKLFASSLEKDDSQQIRDNFSCALENVLKQKLNMIAFSVIQTIVSYQKSTQINVLPPVFVSNVHKKILKFMLSQKEPEYVIAFIILRAESNQHECLEYLKQQLRNNSQRIAFSTFSEMYNKYKNSDECVVDREARLKLFYYSELCKQYPNLRAPTNLDSIGINDFLNDLEKRQLSIELLKKLCKDFGWNYQKMLIRQIKIILNAQQLEFEIKTDQFGKEEVVVKSSVESIKKLCEAYLTEVRILFIFSKYFNLIFLPSDYRLVTARLGTREVLRR
jgi:kinetochore-associated protein 1